MRTTLQLRINPLHFIDLINSNNSEVHKLLGLIIDFKERKNRYTPSLRLQHEKYKQEKTVKKIEFKMSVV